MEGIKSQSEFVRRVSVHLGEPFVLVDVGCSGGIDAGWRAFGARLRAIGFDPDIEECARLQKRESGDAEYIPAFVGLPDDHPFLRKKGNRANTSRNPWSRLSVARSIELKDQSSQDELTNQWHKQRLADLDTRVVLPEFFAARGLCDIDFVKIDVDGRDFEILVSLEESLASCHILAVGIEVNFFGSDSDTDHTLHNVDRFMRSQGFDLFDLSVRRYSVAALPSRYLLPFPAQTELGRPLQGDALYVRDLASDCGAEFAAQLSPAKLLKSACIFELFRLPDCAAELLQRFGDRIDPTLARDLLPLLVPWNVSHEEYIRRFERDDPSFYILRASLKRRLSPVRGILERIARRTGLVDRLRG